MKTIAVCFSGSTFLDPPFDDAYWRLAYQDLAEAIAKTGNQLVIVRHANTYLGGNAFSSGWIFQGDSFVETHEEIHATVILDKSRDFVPSENANVVNDPRVKELCNNKLRSIELLPDLFPVTEVVTDRQSQAQALEKLPSELVVLKPFTGSGGDGIFIGTRDEAKNHKLPLPYLAQEFLDTKAGIPDIVETYHDFRMIIVGGELAICFTRSPGKGKLLSNLSQGGFMVMVPPELRPPGALALIPLVDQLLEDIPTRYYAIDCARVKDGTWKLIELNDQPGAMTRLEMGNLADPYFSVLSNFLIHA